MITITQLKKRVINLIKMEKIYKKLLANKKSNYGKLDKKIKIKVCILTVRRKMRNKFKIIMGLVTEKVWQET